MRSKIFCSLLCGAWLLGACSSSANQCKPGEQSCPCIAQSCNDGLVCSGNTCAPEQRAPLGVDPNARGCEVLLGDSGGTVGQLEFGDDVTGRWLRQGDKVAAAFVANRDSPIGSSAVQVAYAGSGFSILSSRCYGSQGEALAGSTVHR